MFRIGDVMQQRDGEIVHIIARKHGLTLFPELFLAGLLIVIPFFFLFPLTRSGTFGIVVLALLLACGFFLALRAFLMWDADVLVVTSERLVDVDQTGLWSRQVAEAPLIFVQDVVCERTGFADAVCRTGTVRVRSSSASSEIIASRVRRPERIRELIHELRRVDAERSLLAKRAQDERRNRLQVALVESLDSSQGS